MSAQPACGVCSGPPRWRLVSLQGGQEAWADHDHLVTVLSRLTGVENAQVVIESHQEEKQP